MNSYKVQVNGKTRSVVEIPSGADIRKAREVAAAGIQSIIKDVCVKRVVFTAGIINFVI